VSEQPGALVISLDFELHWGVRDHSSPQAGVADSLIASRDMVRTLAELFVKRDVRATWATVGLLFASTAAEADRHMPLVRPAYERPELDPYREPIGRDEQADPLHLAGSLVDQLCGLEGQEVASHTFSHFYCLERGPDEAAFRADLAAAQGAASTRGLRLKSLVLPRNQWRDDYAPLVLATGFECIRGPQPGWANRSRRGDDTGLAARAARLATTYVGPPLHTFGWDQIAEPSGLCNIPASTFLRPLSPRTRSLESLQFHRIIAGLRDAARRGRILHLWWHPQNFVTDPQANLALLTRVLGELDHLRTTEGMRSLSMGDVNDSIRNTQRAA
jgi:peptidoglycan/xylan/chitin deacetylase (PgdA/CDA1 family)